MSISFYIKSVKQFRSTITAGGSPQTLYIYQFHVCVCVCASILFDPRICKTATATSARLESLEIDFQLAIPHLITSIYAFITHLSYVTNWYIDVYVLLKYKLTKIKPNERNARVHFPSRYFESRKIHLNGKIMKKNIICSASMHNNSVGNYYDYSNIVFMTSELNLKSQPCNVNAHCILIIIIIITMWLKLYVHSGFPSRRTHTKMASHSNTQ